MLVWRLVTEQTATLEELETWWSLDDMVRAAAVLDVKQAIEATLIERPPQ